MSETHLTAPTHFVEVDDDRFAYRRWCKPSGIPMFFVSHFRAGLAFWERRHLRKDPDPPSSAQLNGANDNMIPTINSWHLSQNIRNPQLLIYPDACHGAQFQYPKRS